MREDTCCTCFLGNPPCGHCERTSEFLGCGELFYDEKRTAVCPTCFEKYARILEGHQLNCTCRACLAFFNEANGEEGMAVAVPILIEMEAGR